MLVDISKSSCPRLAKMCGRIDTSVSADLEVMSFLPYAEIQTSEEEIVPRFIIQLPHGSDRSVCIRAILAIERHGSHLLTHAEWGCRDGVHCGWAIVEVGNRQEAIQLVPPEARRDAVIVELNTFTKEEMADWVAHEDP